MKVRVTEYLDVTLPQRRWTCNRCGQDLGAASRSYKEGCLITHRDPREVHPVLAPGEEFNFSFDPEWVRLVEFYCPGCGTMVENEYLPPGHPLTWDIELDLDAFERTHAHVEGAATTTDPAA